MFGQTGPKFITQYQIPSVENLGVTYSAGVLTITDRIGGVLSSSNPGYVTMPSFIPGLNVRIPVTSALNLFGDDTALSSNIIGEEFGTTTGIAWGNARPFFIYAVNYDDTAGNLRFAISPNPNLTLSPASTNNIGYSDNVAATPSDNNMHFLTTTNVRSGNVYTTKPALCIGSFSMTKSASDDWTVSTFVASRDGIGRFQEGVEFTMPAGQMGATAAKYFANNGGTAPIFQTNEFTYTLSRNGYCDFRVFFNGDAGTDGAGAVQLQLAAPYIMPTATTEVLNNGRVQFPGAPADTTCFPRFGTTGSALITFNYHGTSATATSNINNSLFTNGARLLYFNGRYKPF